MCLNKEKEGFCMEPMYRLEINGEQKEYSRSTTYGDIAKHYIDDYEDTIVLALFNNQLRELFKRIEGNGTLSFITVAQEPGKKTYRRSVTLLMQKAAHEVMKECKGTIRVLHTIDQGYYCELSGDCTQVVDDKFVTDLKEKMFELVELDLPIYKIPMHVYDAKKMFNENNMYDKERLLRYRRVSKVNVYDLDGYKDYYYGYMVKSTGLLKYFDLMPYEKGFMLLFPSKLNTKQVAPFKPLPKLFKELDDAKDWGDQLGIATVGGLNDEIAAGRMNNIMLVQEAFQEKKISDIAARIKADKSKKFVMIAGPSSSGKTTFANRLSIQLYAQGMQPHMISLDDFFLDREKMIPGEDGKLDYECLEALDVEGFNQCMTDMLSGKKVAMPTFNFRKGCREYRGNYLELKEDDILVIEGIHGLNEKLSYTLPEESKYKIYISALTQLNIDEHNSLPTTDGRLIRRIVRDARTRGTSAQNTLARWESVRAGEEKHIFPFQEEADIMFNSALIYELSILKIYAEPLLFGIPADCPEYIEAKRLLKLLEYVLPYPSDAIEKNSILREFVGGSCFNV